MHFSDAQIKEAMEFILKVTNLEENPLQMGDYEIINNGNPKLARFYAKLGAIDYAIRQGSVPLWIDPSSGEEYVILNDTQVFRAERIEFLGKRMFTLKQRYF